MKNQEQETEETTREAIRINRTIQKAQEYLMNVHGVFVPLEVLEKEMEKRNQNPNQY